jgi:ABC-type Na+ efflux pump permease subunit
METLTIILLIAIAVFAIGNILLYFLDKKTKENRLPLGDANNEIVSSKLDVLNKRISRLEQNKNENNTTKKEIIVVEKTKKIIPKKKEKSKSKTAYPITKYKRKKKK